MLPDGVALGTIRFGSRIEAIDAERWLHAPHETPVGGDDSGAEPGVGGTGGGARRDPARSGDGSDALPWIVPGFVDVHVHGGGGGDVMDGVDGLRTAARTHLRHGTTTFVPTTMTAPWGDVLGALEAVDAVARQTPDATEPLPSIPGAHLEGPFLSPDRLGAQPPHPLAPTPARIDAVLATGVVRVATLAPELDGAAGAARRLSAAGVRVSAGHTRAGAGTAHAFWDAVRAEGGTAGATHLFNAMGGVRAREPGVAGAALAREDVHCELICDGHHVAPEVVRMVRRTAGARLMLVTDAIRAAGTDATTTTVGSRSARVEAGAVRLEDGTLAGSVATMDRVVRTFVEGGATVAEAVRAASTTPARYLGLDDRGALEVGRRADLVVLGPGLDVLEVVARGRPVPGERMRGVREDPGRSERRH